MAPSFRAASRAEGSVFSAATPIPVRRGPADRCRACRTANRSPLSPISPDDVGPAQPEIPGCPHHPADGVDRLDVHRAHPVLGPDGATVPEGKPDGEGIGEQRPDERGQQLGDGAGAGSRGAGARLASCGRARLGRYAGSRGRLLMIHRRCSCFFANCHCHLLTYAVHRSGHHRLEWCRAALTQRQSGPRSTRCGTSCRHRRRNGQPPLRVLVVLRSSHILIPGPARCRERGVRHPSRLCPSAFRVRHHTPG